MQTRTKLILKNLSGLWKSLKQFEVWKESDTKNAIMSVLTAAFFKKQTLLHLREGISQMWRRSLLLVCVAQFFELPSWEISNRTAVKAADVTRNNFSAE